MVRLKQRFRFLAAECPRILNIGMIGMEITVVENFKRVFGCLIKGFPAGGCDSPEAKKVSDILQQLINGLLSVGHNVKDAAIETRVHKRHEGVNKIINGNEV